MIFSEFKKLINDIELDFPKDKLTFTTLINQVIYNNRFRLILNYRVGNYLIKRQSKIFLFFWYLEMKKVRSNLTALF